MADRSTFFEMADEASPAVTLLAMSARNQEANEYADGGVGTSALLDCITGRALVREDVGSLELFDIAQVVIQRVRRSGDQNPVLSALNVHRRSQFCRNPLFQASSHSALRKWEPRAFLDAVEPVLASHAHDPLDLIADVERLFGHLIGKADESRDVFKGAATSIEPSRIFAYMLARLTDSFAEVQGQVAQPNELGTVYLLAAPLFDLTDVFDEAMSELDHVTINAFVADDHSLFALETIDNGENNPFTIGHYIWRIDELLQHFPPHAFVQPTDPSVAGGAILASLIFPDRVPWFVFRALDQLEVLSG